MNVFIRRHGSRFGFSLVAAWLLGLSEFIALARSRRGLRSRRARAVAGHRRL